MVEPDQADDTGLGEGLKGYGASGSSRPLRLAFEASSAATPRPTGIGRYITSLVPAVGRALGGAVRLCLLYKASRLRSREDWWRPAGFDLRTYPGDRWPWPGRCDLVHGLDGSVPLWRGARRVVTFHDLYVLRDDRAAPEWFRVRRRAAYRRAAGHAHGIIAVSEATRRELADVLDVPASRVYVVPQGVDARFRPQPEEAVERARRAHGLTGPYLLFVGSVSARKNTARLVRAFGRSRLDSEMKLILAGEISYRGEATRRAVADCGLGDRVRILGYVPDQDLPALYTGARGFVFPTSWEGFGLPLLEAMACGTPVMAADRGAAAETSGGFAVFVDPDDEQAIAEGMVRLLEVPASRTEQATRHARSFTWERCARQTLEVYRNVLCR